MAYSAEFETPWLNPSKNEKAKGNRSLIIRPPKSSARSQIAHVNKDGRNDSFDSTSSYSSIQERIPDFDPDTYVITTKPPSVSSRGLRSDSSDSGQSLSSQSSNIEQLRLGEDVRHCLSKSVEGKCSDQVQQFNSPRKMVINVNGKKKAPERRGDNPDRKNRKEEGDAGIHEEQEKDGFLNEENKKRERMAPLANLEGKIDVIDNDDVFATDEIGIKHGRYEQKEDGNGKVSSGDHQERVWGSCAETSKLKDLKLEAVNSEYINEVMVHNVDQPMMTLDGFAAQTHSKIQVKSGMY